MLVGSNGPSRLPPQGASGERSLRGASVTREGIRLGTAAPEALARRGAPSRSEAIIKPMVVGFQVAHRGRQPPPAALETP